VHWAGLKEVCRKEEWERIRAREREWRFLYMAGREVEMGGCMERGIVVKAREEEEEEEEEEEDEEDKEVDFEESEVLLR